MELNGWQMTFGQFNNLFEEEMKTAAHYTEAYEAVEQEHEEKTGQRRYSDYNSFRNTRKNNIKKNKRNKVADESLP